jgi:hypothetical protein
MWYLSQMASARERARIRIEAWFEERESSEQKQLQRAFGKRLGHSQSWVSRMVRELGPRVEELDAIAELMEVDVASLVARDENAHATAQRQGLSVVAIAVAKAFDELEPKQKASVLISLDAFGHPVAMTTQAQKTA